MTVNEIVREAVSLADTEGIEALTMQRLASRLGVTPMALYRYVPSKEDLIFLAVDAASGNPPDAPAEGEGWRSGLERWSRAQIDGLRRHPWVSRVPITAPPIGPKQVAWMERCLECMAGTSLSLGERVGVLNLLGVYGLGHSRLYGELTRASSARGLSLGEVERQYGELIGQIVDPTRFPHVAAGFAAMASDPPTQSDAAADFEFGLARILDGVAALVEHRRRGRVRSR